MFHKVDSFLVLISTTEEKINNIDEAMVEYYQAFGKEKNPYHLSLIRFLRSIRRPEKWWNIIWYSKHKPNKVCSLELYEVYQPNHLWTGIKSCLYQKGCRAMVNKTSTLASSISKPKKINHPHYNMKNTMSSINLTRFMCPIISSKTYMYLLTCVDDAFRCKISRARETKDCICVLRNI